MTISAPSKSDSPAKNLRAFEISCRHCGTPIPPARSGTFCCDGCESVHSFLFANGLGDFYDVVSDVPLKPVDPRLQDRDFQSLDLAENLDAISSDGNRIDFYVEDLSCTACVWILDRLETASADVAWSQVNLNRSIVTVARQNGAKFSDIASLIHKLGFKAEPVAAHSHHEELERRGLRRSLIRTGVMGALTGNIMLLSVSLYGGADGDLGTLFRWLMGALALPIVTWGAWPLYVNSWRSLMAKRISLDIPISFAVLAGFTAGAIGLITNQDLLYFDSVAMLVFLLQSSRSALDFLKRKFATVDTVPNWLLQTVRNTTTLEHVLPDQIIKNLPISLSAGQRLPVDARSESLGTLWDVSVLTGESRPHRATFRETLAAGSLLISESADLIALGTIRDSRVAKLLREWREGLRERKSLSEVSDHVGQIFTIAVLTFAALLVSVELTTGFSAGPNGWIRALTLLLAACPCVFGIGIPLAENLVINRLAEKGLMVREPSFLQKLNRIKAVFFDKTGTLTTGRMAIASIHTFGATAEEVAIRLAAGLERDQVHPIARAISALAKNRGISGENFETQTTPLIRDQRQTGVEARLGAKTYRLEANVPGAGESSFENLGYDRLDKQQCAIRLTVCGEMSPEETLAVFVLEDELRPGVLETVKKIKKLYEVRILSGDQAGPVAKLLSTLGLKPESGLSGLSPEAKAAYIETNSPRNDCLMIGDGANDAEALKQSFASIALKGDLTSCLDSADAVLVVDSLAPVVFALQLAKRLRATLLTTLTLSTAINLIAAVLAISGLITPLIAAVLMPTSGLIVTLTTWRMLKKEIE